MGFEPKRGTKGRYPHAMAPTPPTAPGWHPDPWGTSEMRYFDGSAWGIVTRPNSIASGSPDVESLEANPLLLESPAASENLANDSGARGVVEPLPGAAWYADPGGSEGLRWWDGARWTEHVSAASQAIVGVSKKGAPTDPSLIHARAVSSGRLVRTLLLFAGPALAATIISGAFQMRWLADNFDSVWRDAQEGRPITIPLSASGGSFLAAFSQVGGLVCLVTGIFFLVWLGQSGRVAKSLGFVLRRSPWLGAWALVIPVVQWWWPYRATLDLLPERDETKSLVVQWWLPWLGTSVAQVGVVIAAFAAMPDIAISVLAAGGASCALLAAFKARDVIAEVEKAHAELVRRPGQ